MSAKKGILPDGNLPAGLSQPALRALAGTGIRRLEQLTRFTEVQIKELHGIGPNGIKQLKAAPHSGGLAFARNKK